LKSDREKALACIDALPCSSLTYTEWLNVGMALEHSGCSAADWDAWSARDSKRYHPGECERKWRGFRGHQPPVTLGTLIELTRQNGCLPDGLWSFDGDDSPPVPGFGWDDPLPRGKAEPSAAWVQPDDLPAPAGDWKPMDLARYLEAMYQPEERVGLCVEAWKPEGKDDGRWLPKKGVYDRTAGALIELIHGCGGDLGAVIGDIHPEAGAWIRINPLDGNGVRDDNVTVLRHALLEADDGDLGKQLALIRDMQLPVSAIVHSGGKSIHALVRVEAKDLAEYRARVDYLFRTAERYGLAVDGGNRNPSRLSRMPGVLRGDKPQYLISGPAGLPSWEAWVNHTEDLKDDLPDPEQLSLTDLPELAPVLIDGTLRTGRKMLLTGPSKAGKTMALMGLCSAIANGSDWMGMACTQGRVLYLNLELPADTCAHRFQHVYKAHNGLPENYQNITVWNLRGQSAPLDKLGPKLIRRCEGRKFAAIVVDPIYKVTTGDENDAEDMGGFCNNLDRIALRLGCAVVYAHHHSKGAQGHKKAMDRASGSGVLARDADAIVDMIELDLAKERRETLANRLVRDAIDRIIDAETDGNNEIEEEARGKADAYLQAAQMAYPAISDDIREQVLQANKRAAYMTGWRIECTLREFAFPPPRRVWFDYPVHYPDVMDILTDAKAAGEEPPWVADREAKEVLKKEKAKESRHETIAAVDACGGPGQAMVSDVAGELGISERACRDRIDMTGKYRRQKGLIVLKKESKK
jgi:RecA-family ATPase